MTRVCHNLNNTHRCNGNPDELMKDQPDEERDLQIHHINAARVCYHILRRLDDLTGTVYTWSPKFDPDNKQRIQFGMQQIDLASSSNGFDPSMKPEKREVAVKHFEKLDNALWEAYNKECEEADVDGAGMVQERYELFANTFLIELDSHGGEKMGDKVDRFWFFTATTVSIEFIRDDQLQKLYFCSPTKQTVLPDSVRNETRINELDLSSPQDKCRTLLEAFEKLRLGLKRQRWLKQYKAGYLIAEGSGVWHKWAHLLTTYTNEMISIMTARSSLPLLVTACSARTSLSLPCARWSTWIP